jgi:acetoacetyl-CoA synthetase
MDDSDVLWRPSPEHLARSNLTSFLQWLRATRGYSFTSYAELWRWSVTELTDFWAALWDYYALDEASGYDEVLSRQGRGPEPA